MLTETALSWTGLTDSAPFREALRFESFPIDTDEGETHFAAHLQLPSMGLQQEWTDPEESGLLKKVQGTIDQWIPLWKQWQETQAREKAEKALEQAYEHLLTDSLRMSQKVNLDVLRNTITFETSEIHQGFLERLAAIMPPTLPSMGFVPPKPVYTEPDVKLSDRMMFRKKGIIRQYEEDYARKLETWEKICDKIRLQYEAQMNAYFEAMKVLDEDKNLVEREMAEARLAYEELRRQQNESVDILYINYQGRQEEAVERFLSIGIEQAQYPAGIPRNVLVEYHRDNQTLYVSMELPHPGSMPLGQFPGGAQPASNLHHATPANATPAARYNDIVYKLILRQVHEILSADEASIVNAISLNAWVRTLNRGNGQYENVCIATLFTTREDFDAINLSQVDPALCFRFLKGVSGPQLTDLTPVPTQFTLSPKTGTPVPQRKALEPLYTEKNLANLPWTEFESLVMELFAHEFGDAGARLTLVSSSPEQGLEATGIDPDPLRGGTIVCMARRSSKPIALPAVRELFGTIMHEGAIKGVLATTADFTTEVYEFAKHKPISLLNGTALLALFEKHGYKLRINLREAVSLEHWLS